MTTQMVAFIGLLVLAFALHFARLWALHVYAPLRWCKSGMAECLGQSKSEKVKIYMLRSPDAFAFSQGILHARRIFVSSALLNLLPLSEVHAIISHEEGHHALGHLRSRAIRMAFLPFSQHSRCIREELEADAYAARSNGAMAMISALLTIANCTKSAYNKSEAKVRIEALEALARTARKIP